MTLTLNGTTGEVFPTWTTAGRPASPSTGQTGFNTTTGQLETYNGTAWVINSASTSQGTAGQYLQSNGSGASPSYVDFPTVSVTNGGTGLTTLTAANRALYSTSASALTAGTLPVAAGGTGVTTSTGSGSVVLSTSPALTTPNLGTPSAAVLTSATGLPLTTGVTGTLPVANGGTGAATLTANNVLLGNGTSAVQAVAPGTNGNVLTSNGTTWTSSAPAAASGSLIRAPQLLTSGTSYTTPSNCTKIYVELWGAGGGGGGARCNASGSATAIGGPGGGGAYLAKYLTVTASTAYTIAIGAGGTAGSGPATTTAGGTGGTTSITVSATTYSATGGTGGGLAVNTAAGTTVTGTNGAGGTATNGDLNVSSLAGGYFGASVGGSSQAFIGLGGVTPSANGVGGTGLYYSAGGGGGYFQGTGGNNNGGAGYQGLIRIWEYT